MNRLPIHGLASKVQRRTKPYAPSSLSSSSDSSEEGFFFKPSAEESWESGDKDSFFSNYKCQEVSASCRSTASRKLGSKIGAKIELFDFYDASNFVKPSSGSVPATSTESSVTSQAEANQIPEQRLSNTQLKTPQLYNSGSLPAPTEDSSEDPETQRVQEKDSKAALKAGRWSQAEHQLFLEALRLYGKDWEKIKLHIGDRPLKAIRAHAQKYMLRLTNHISGARKMKNLKDEEVQYYYQTLNKKLHRYARQDVPQWSNYLEVPEKEMKQSEQHIFSIEQHASRRPGTERGQEPRQAGLAPLRLAEFANEPQTLVESQFNSENLPRNQQQSSKTSQLYEAFMRLPDIDQDDQSPELILHLVDMGIKIDLLAMEPDSTLPLSLPLDFLLYFARHRLPRLYHHLTQVKNNQNSYTQATEVDIEKAILYTKRPAQKQRTSVSLTYVRRGARCCEVIPNGAPLKLELSQKTVETLLQIQESSQQQSSDPYGILVPSDTECLLSPMSDVRIAIFNLDSEHA